jgi:hypothetical protein
MSDSVDYIYMLCNEQGLPFYVGRTNDPARRLGEHRRDSRTGHELKYQHIRSLEAAGQDWNMEILQECGADTEHYEDFWVYTLIREGYNLTNMKMGDSVRAAEQAAVREMLGQGRTFNTPQEFLAERERVILAQAALKRNQALIQKVRKESTADSIDESRMLFDWERPEQKFVSPWMRARRGQGHVWRGPKKR